VKTKRETKREKNERGMKKRERIKEKS